MTVDWMKNLKPLTLDVRPLRLPGEAEPDPATEANVIAGLPMDLKHVSRATRRKFIDGRRVNNAAKLIERLPEEGEAYHLVLNGSWAAWNLVGAVLALAAPARIDELTISTLGFSSGNANELLEMLDDGRIGRVSFLCSHYFKGTSAEIFNPLAAGLHMRGMRISAMRSHAKVMCFALSDGRKLVSESSANLRSCKNCEQLTLVCDAGLYQFHKSWIEEMLCADDHPHPQH